MSARSAPSIAASSPACGVSTACAGAAVDVGERVGVDHDRHVVGERRCQLVAARAHRPRTRRPTPARGPSPTTSGCASRTRSATASGPTYRTIPQSPLAAPATLSRAAPGYCALPARTPTTPRAYFCESGAGRGSRSATSSGWSASTGGGREVEPDVDQLDRARGPRGRVDQVRDLVGAEGDGQRRLDVSVRPARRCRRRRRSGCRPRRPARRCTASSAATASGFNPGRAADPDDPVDHDVGSSA